MILFFESTAAKSQDSLHVKYQNLIETTETFNQYKVIPRTTIDLFWSEVMDTLRKNDEVIKSMMTQVQAQNDSIENLNSRSRELGAQLEESLTQNDSIAFVGINVSKTTYHLIVWALITILLVATILVYFMFMKSNRVTVRSKKELEALQTELDDHKNKSRENQAKLKRELQTAINKMEEMKRGRS